jgi:hypothetical protein
MVEHQHPRSPRGLEMRTQSTPKRKQTAICEPTIVGRINNGLFVNSTRALKCVKRGKETKKVAMVVAHKMSWQRANRRAEKTLAFFFPQIASPHAARTWRQNLSGTQNLGGLATFRRKNRQGKCRSRIAPDQGNDKGARFGFGMTLTYQGGGKTHGSKIVARLP